VEDANAVAVLDALDELAEVKARQRLVKALLGHNLVKQLPARH
jgi:hypothetical protein